MNEEEKFDELINSKLSERDFPFDELNWDEAERLIIRQEKWAGTKRISLIFSAGLALGIAIMLPFVLNNHTNTPTTISQSKSSTNIIAATDANSTLVQSDNSIVNKTNNNEKEAKGPLPVQSAFVKKDNSTGFRTNSAGISGTKKKSTKQPIMLATDRKKIDEQEAPPIANTVVASSLNTDNSSSHKQNSITGSIEPVSVQVPNASPVPVSNRDIPKNQPISTSNSATQINATIPTNNTPVNNNPTNTPPTATNHKKANKAAKEKSSKKDVATKSNSNSDVSDKAAPPIKKDTIMAESRMVLPGTEQPYVPQYAANILSAYAGGNYSFGWNNDGVREGSGITPLGGFIYTHYFSYHYSASIGVGYSELNKLDETYTSSMIQYDFGENANITTVTPERVYYIAFPIKLQYNITDKSIFSIGFDFLWMLTTESKLTTYQQGPFAQTTPSSTMQNGYTQGFSNFDFQFTMAFTRMLTNRFGIRPEYYFGANYIENNSFPGINQFERNMGVRLVLSYQLMK